MDKIDINISNRQIKLLKILFDCDGYITSDKLAKMCGITTRTIRSDIKSLHFFIFENELNNIFEIKSSKESGYRVNILNQKKYVVFMNDIKRDNLNRDWSNIREFEIIIWICFKYEISISEIADKIYFSENYIRNNYLNSVKMVLKKYNLALINNRTLKIVGLEQDIRVMLIDILFDDIRNENFSENTRKLFENEQFEKDIKNIFYKKICKNKYFSLSEMSIRTIAKYLLIMNLRLQFNTIKFSDNDKFYLHQFTNEMQFANEIIIEINQIVPNKLLEEEVCFLAILIISFAYLKVPDINLLSDQNKMNTLNIIQTLMKIYNLNEKEVDSLKDALIRFFYGFDSRKRNNIYCKYIIKNRVRRNQPSAVECVCQIMLALNIVNINEYEIILLVSFLMSFFENQKNKGKITKLLIASKFGLIEANRIKNSILYRYERYIEKIDCCEVYELAYYQDQYNYVLTDLSLTYFEDFEKFMQYKTYVCASHLNYDVKYKIKKSVGNIDMFINTVSEKDIEKNICFLKKQDVFKYIVDMNNQNNALMSYDRLMARENLCSYEVGNCALIHIANAQSNDVSYKFLVLSHAILWKKFKVQLVIIVNTNQIATNIQYLDEPLWQLIAHEDNVNLFINSPNTITLFEIIKKNILV